MSRIRTIKPEFWRNEELSALPEATHILAAALLNYADDEGFFNANPKLVQAECTPLRDPSVSVQDSLNMLSKTGFIRLGFGEDGKRYGQVIKFTEHQRINRPTPSKISQISIEWDASQQTHTQITEESPPERKGKEGKGRERSVCTKPPKGRFAYPDDFEEFWKNYPTDAIMSKAEAFKEFIKLDAEDKQGCVIASPGFAAYCRAHPDYRPVHANRFISQRRFDEFAKQGRGAEDLVVLASDDPLFKAIERLRGKPVMVGQSGKATFRKSEVEQAKAHAA